MSSQAPCSFQLLSLLGHRSWLDVSIRRNTAIGARRRTCQNANLASKNSFSRSTAAIRWRHEPMAQRWVAASGETFARWQIAATRYNARSQHNQPGRFVERNLLHHRQRKTSCLGGIGIFELARTGDRKSAG